MKTILKAAVAASLAVGAASAAQADDLNTAQVLEALIVAGAEQPLSIENEDYVRYLNERGLTEDLSGVMADVFSSMTQAIEMSHTCETLEIGEECWMHINYQDEFEGETYESSMILSFTLVDGRIKTTEPVRVMLAG